MRALSTKACYYYRGHACHPQWPQNQNPCSQVRYDCTTVHSSSLTARKSLQSWIYTEICWRARTQIYHVSTRSHGSTFCTSSLSMARMCLFSHSPETSHTGMSHETSPAQRHTSVCSSAISATVIALILYCR